MDDSLCANRARVRLARLASTVLASPVSGGYDSKGDNHLRTSELFGVKGKVALVTGGSLGIGRMIAEGLSINGCKVYITSRTLAACEATAKELNELGGAEVIPFASDLSKPEGCQAAADFISARDKKLHILVNNAGATWGATFDTYPPEAFNRIFDLNVKGVFMTTQKLAPLLEAAGELGDPARVINISSVAGKMPQSTDHPAAAYAYAASKAAVTHMSVGLSKVLGDRNISTNVIAPGLFMTKMNAHIVNAEGAEKGLAGMNPLQRNGQPQDMAGTALFLCSKAGSYVNGAVIPVDGGLSIQ